MQALGGRALRPASRPAQAQAPRPAVRPAARRLVARRAAEVQEQAPEVVEEQLTPMERAKKAVASETLDKDVLASCLADLESEMAKMQEASAASDGRVKTLEASTSTAKEQFLRLTADFDNYRRRTGEEKAQIADSARSDVVKDLLPLVDAFELARTQVKAETEGEQRINNSYQGLYKQMVELMRTLGVEAVPTVGTPFDPEIHDAIMRQPDAEHPDGTVLKEFRKGFRLGDKLIRPAMVQVSYTEDAGPIASSEE